MATNLDTLPPEILFNILSYTSPFDSSLLPLHPFYTTAATCWQLRDVVEGYSRILLAQHAKIKPPKRAKTSAFVCRRKWVRWVTTTCRLCGSSSRRRAILQPGLTCCQKCDKLHFPKMTMTEAIQTHGLSKLDLFTPNRLHPTLPPLTPMGTYMCMGSDTLMISTPSVLARKDYIRGLLGEKGDDIPYLRRRVMLHDRLIKHMDIAHRVIKGKGRWYKAYQWPESEADGEAQHLPLSLRSREMRDEYVTSRLEKEWRDLGMGEPGSSVEEAIEIE